MYFLYFENGRDGFGAQFFNQIFGIMLAKYFDINYYYEPLTRVGHNYSQNKDFENELNNFTNLANLYNQEKIDETIEIVDLIMVPQIIKNKTDKKIALLIKKNADNFYKFGKCFNYNSDLLDKIKNNFLKDKINPYDTNKKNIAIHIRSGDILFNLKYHKARFTKEDSYVKLINYLHKKLKENYLIHIFFQSETTLGYDKPEIHKIDKNVFNVNKLLGKNTILHENGDLKNDFLYFVFADYLFVAKSTFSILASIFNKNKVYSIYNFSKNQFNFLNIKSIDENNISID